MKEKHMEHISRRGSVLDLFLVCLILLSIVGVGMRWKVFYRDDNEKTLTGYRMTARMEGGDPRVVECLEVGERLYTAAGDAYGSIAQVSTAPTKIEILSNGVYHSGEWDPEVKCDLYVEIHFEGSENDGRVLWNGLCACLVGDSLTLYSERTALHLKIINISDFND